MGIEQHLMCLQGIGAQQVGAAVRQLDMCNLQLRALTAENREVLAPVELEGLPGAESQRNKGAAASCLLVALTICPPLSRKGRHPVVGTGEAKHHEIGMHLLQRLPVLARLPGIRLEPARKLLGKGIKLARPIWRREVWLDRIVIQILLDRVPRHPSASRDLPDRQALP